MSNPINFGGKINQTVWGNSKAASFDLKPASQNTDQINNSAQNQANQTFQPNANNTLSNNKNTFGSTSVGQSAPASSPVFGNSSTTGIFQKSTGSNFLNPKGFGGLSAKPPQQQQGQSANGTNFGGFGGFKTTSPASTPTTFQSQTTGPFSTGAGFGGLPKNTQLNTQGQINSPFSGFNTTQKNDSAQQNESQEKSPDELDMSKLNVGGSSQNQTIGRTTTFTPPKTGNAESGAAKLNPFAINKSPASAAPPPSFSFTSKKPEEEEKQNPFMQGKSPVSAPPPLSSFTSKQPEGDKPPNPFLTEKAPSSVTAGGTGAGGFKGFGPSTTAIPATIGGTGTSGFKGFNSSPATGTEIGRTASSMPKSAVESAAPPPSFSFTSKKPEEEEKANPFMQNKSPSSEPPKLGSAAPPPLSSFTSKKPEEEEKPNPFMQGKSEPPKFTSAAPPPSFSFTSKKPEGEEKPNPFSTEKAPSSVTAGGTVTGGFKGFGQSTTTTGGIGAGGFKGFGQSTTTTGGTVTGGFKGFGQSTATTTGGIGAGGFKGFNSSTATPAAGGAQPESKGTPEDSKTDTSTTASGRTLNFAAALSQNKQDEAKSPEAAAPSPSSSSPSKKPEEEETAEPKTDTADSPDSNKSNPFLDQTKKSKIASIGQDEVPQMPAQSSLTSKKQEEEKEEGEKPAEPESKETSDKPKTGSFGSNYKFSFNKQSGLNSSPAAGAQPPSFSFTSKKPEEKADNPPNPLTSKSPTSGQPKTKMVNSYGLKEEFVIKFYDMMFRMNPKSSWEEVDAKLKDLAPLIPK